ncbi:Bug family tripartite tricarboxylate transporter substrate binding protein [Catellatospora citrea]|uniref:C4-dicarboxylate ABC transporter substrate-binding protein n=1 Tax=Catellatospora citrea TaxID=53366 RepID=A0A8J3KE10_9ACTN|nr:tripartite tricarboxylate transporter substrate-binding protein [Catellatospora citrea]RKE12157.1 putative tricarboxylic transport membrane protein [Catellatospora citrea]GIF98879.1 C4-dicarboxylate ABC transporter substrate-binding protein [Catellatospora citrea]
MLRRTLVVALPALLLATTACAEQSVGDPNAPAGSAVAYPSKTLQIMAPAGAGGGWDTTARTMQQALQGAGLLNGQSAEVRNVTGAAGTIGLAELVTSHKGDAHQLMVTGLVMVGGVVTNKSPVDLSQTTPIATLTAESEVIVVKSDSKYQTLKQLVDDVKANPTSVKWGGGSAGGTDQILVGLLAKAAGADAKTVAKQYIAYSGGGETKAGLLSGDISVAVSGTSEFADLVKAGTVRALAVSSAAAGDAGLGTPTPSIKESGYDLELMNWRGLVAPPGISDAEKTAVIAMIDKLHSSAQWKQALTDKKWTDFYRTGDQATSYFADENTRIKAVLTEIGLG